MSQKVVKFHIKSDDYFGTLSTILGLIRQKNKSIKDFSIIKKIETDLIFLQDQYKIIKK